MRAPCYDDARKVFEDILDEVPHLSAVEKKNNRVWFSKIKDELKTMPV